MNANSVPEVSGSGDELETLATQLAGHKAFAACRGNIHGIHYLYEDLVRKSASPNDFCAKFDVLSAQLRFVGKMLVKLRRDKKDAAFEEMWKALILREFVLTHETVPLDRTTPFTVLMLEPAKTFVLARWMATALTYNLTAFVGKKPRGWRSDGQPGPGACTEELFKTFPDLAAATVRVHESGGDNGSELKGVYQAGLSGLPRQFPDAMPLICARANMLLDSAERGGSGSSFSFPLAYLFRGKTQDEVLRLFGRDEQERVATWQLHVPTLVGQGQLGWKNIGFYPEAEHRSLSKQLPSFTSAGVAHGHGLMLLDHATGDKARRLFGVDHIVHVSSLWNYREEFKPEDPTRRIILVPRSASDRD